MTYFIFNSLDSRNFGAYVFAKNPFEVAVRNVEKVNVPGVSGDLLIDNGSFENETIEYNVIITDNFRTKVSGMNNALASSRGYCRLEDDFNADEFRLAAFHNGIVIDKLVGSKGSVSGRFTCRFDCKPQRYLKSGETGISVSAGTTKTISNPTLFESLPKILVTGTGTFTVNARQITVSNNNSSGITIDSEVSDCYSGSLNRNSVVSIQDNVFPVLVPGDNIITTPSGMTLSIIPRWFRL